MSDIPQIPRSSGLANPQEDLVVDGDDSSRHMKAIQNLRDGNVLDDEQDYGGNEAVKDFSVVALGLGRSQLRNDERLEVRATEPDASPSNLLSETLFHDTPIANTPAKRVDIDYIADLSALNPLTTSAIREAYGLITPGSSVVGGASMYEVSEASTARRRNYKIPTVEDATKPSLKGELRITKGVTDTPGSEPRTVRPMTTIDEAADVSDKPKPSGDRPMTQEITSVESSLEISKLQESNALDTGDKCNLNLNRDLSEGKAHESLVAGSTTAADVVREQAVKKALAWHQAQSEKTSRKQVRLEEHTRVEERENPEFAHSHGPRRSSKSSDDELKQSQKKSSKTNSRVKRQKQCKEPNCAKCIEARAKHALGDLEFDTTRVPDIVSQQGEKLSMRKQGKIEGSLGGDGVHGVHMPSLASRRNRVRSNAEAGDFMVDGDEMKVRIDPSNGFQMEFDGRLVEFNPVGDGSIAELIIGGKRRERGDPTNTSERGSEATESETDTIEDWSDASSVISRRPNAPQLPKISRAHSSQKRASYLSNATASTWSSLGRPMSSTRFHGHAAEHNPFLGPPAPRFEDQHLDGGYLAAHGAWQSRRGPPWATSSYDGPGADFPQYYNRAMYPPRDHENSRHLQPRQPDVIPQLDSNNPRLRTGPEVKFNPNTDVQSESKHAEHDTEVRDVPHNMDKLDTLLDLVKESQRMCDQRQQELVQEASNAKAKSSEREQRDTDGSSRCTYREVTVLLLSESSLSKPLLHLMALFPTILSERLGNALHPVLTEYVGRLCESAVTDTEVSVCRAIKHALPRDSPDAVTRLIKIVATLPDAVKQKISKGSCSDKELVVAFNAFEDGDFIGRPIDLAWIKCFESPQVQAFLFSGGSGVRLKKDIQDLATPKRPSAAALRQSAQRHEGVNGITDLFHVSEAIAHAEPRSVCIGYQRPPRKGLAPYTAQLQLMIEDITDAQWDWWPMLPPQQPVLAGHELLSWLCECGERRSASVPCTFADDLKVMMYQRSSAGEGTATHLEGKMFNVASTACSDADVGSQSNTASGRNALELTDLERGSLSPSPSSTFNKDRLSHTRTLSSQGSTTLAGSIASQQDIDDFMQRFVFLSIKKGQNLCLAQISVWNVGDQGFFAALRREYRKHKGWFRKWFSVWKFAHCDFTMFEKIAENEVVHRPEGGQLPPDSRKDYAFAPRPADVLPPISRHEFRKRFYQSIRAKSASSPGKTCCRTKCALQRIPKRDIEVTESGDERDLFWGLLAIDEISFIFVMFYFFVLIAPTLSFWIYWMKTGHATDLQNASVPFFAAIGGLSLFWFLLMHR